MSKKKVIGFQTDDLADKILELKEQEAKAIGSEFNKSKFIRGLIHTSVLEAEKIQ